MTPEPITVTEAGNRLNRAPATIHKWGERYAARQLGRVERRMYFDWNDLATIDGCITRGEDIPRTPEERDRLREQLRTRWQNAA